ncbi:Transmembrane protein 115 [Schistosoma japonicum]|uniref:Putative PL6 protein n=1 Tax=Schistosoma japonicum TaxID=6182 RepID=C1L587_SCHJA|nr:Transmembrane protein 115 [Schistosoma japonicum]KAH8871352.1 Transmembrane protein 115 [Schistosoma japonicum]CAX69865.1 putative PL6 protein [Schistosoma japonicum]
MVRIVSLKLFHVQLFLCTLQISSFISGLCIPFLVEFVSLPLKSAHDLYKLFTFHLLTDEFSVFILTLPAVFIYTKLVFDLWSKVEMVFYYWFVNVSAAALSILLTVLNDDNISISRVNGSSAFVSSVLVLLIQLNSEQPLISIRGLSIKSRYGLPVFSILFSILCVTRFIRLSSLILFCNGVLCSWCYLRLFQRHPQGRRGDCRSSFALARLFSEPVDKVVSVPFNVCYQLLMRIKLFRKLKSQNEIIVEPVLTFGFHGQISDPERYRRIALKALSERDLKASSSSKGSEEIIEWPSLIDSDDTQKLENHISNESSVIIKLPGDMNSSNVDTLSTFNSSNV